MSGDVVPVNDLSRGWIARSRAVREAVENVLASGWFVHGPEHSAFERDLERFLDVSHVVGVASGTDALTLALLGIGCASDWEIIVPPNAGGYASLAAARIGCQVVYADVDPRTLLITTDTVAAAASSKTRAVITTHLYGNTADVPALSEWAAKHDILVIEDCAQAIGATIGGRHVGTFGAAGAFSFYPTKNLGAAGDAGAVVSADPTVSTTVRSLRQYGWTDKYHIGRPGGMNSRLDELQAAILRIGLGLVDTETERRRAIVARYAEALRGTETAMVSGATPSFVAHLAVLRTPDRGSFRKALADEGIQTDIHYPVPDHRQVGLPPPARETILREADRATEEVLTIPCFPAMTDAEVDRVSVALARAASR